MSLPDKILIIDVSERSSQVLRIPGGYFDYSFSIALKSLLINTPGRLLNMLSFEMSFVVIPNPLVEPFQGLALSPLLFLEFGESPPLLILRDQPLLKGTSQNLMYWLAWWVGSWG